MMASIPGKNCSPKDMQIGFPIPTWVDDVFLFLLFLCFGTSLRFSVGPFTLGLAEPAAFAFILWKLTTEPASPGLVRFRVSGILYGFTAAAIWISLLWVMSNDWRGRANGITGWILAAALMSVLFRKPPRDWQRVAVLLVLAAIPNLVICILQHFLGIGMPPKNLLGWNQDASLHPVIGLFGHSNDLAVYLYWPLMLSAGLAIRNRGWRRNFFAAVGLVCCVILYWSLSRTVLVTMGVVGVSTALFYALRNRRAFTASMAAGAGLTVTGVILLLATQSTKFINTLLSGRPALWNRALAPILHDPILLPFGYLAVPPPSLPIGWLPHNIFIYAWLNFGWPGLFLLCGLIVYILRFGWQRYNLLRSNPFLGVMWLALLGMLLVNGLASLYLHENYIVLYFASLLAVWVGWMVDSHPPMPVGG
jgi:hypothetical protein